MPVGYEMLHDLIHESGGHEAILARGPGLIYVDCTHCSFSTVWQPDETTRQVAARWNGAHR